MILVRKILMTKIISENSPQTCCTKTSIVHSSLSTDTKYRYFILGFFFNGIIIFLNWSFHSVARSQKEEMSYILKNNNNYISLSCFLILLIKQRQLAVKEPHRAVSASHMSRFLGFWKCIFFNSNSSSILLVLNTIPKLN